MLAEQLQNEPDAPRTRYIVHRGRPRAGGLIASQVCLLGL
jgi:hypothetical protein